MRILRVLVLSALFGLAASSVLNNFLRSPPALPFPVSALLLLSLNSLLLAFEPLSREQLRDLKFGHETRDKLFLVNKSCTISISIFQE